MTKCSAGLPVLVLALWVTATPAHSQVKAPTPMRAASPSCVRCQLRIDQVAVIGSPDDDVLLDVRSAPVRDRRGNYIAWSAEHGRINVYDTLGRLRHTFGRKGEGPGELTSNYLPILPLEDGSLAVVQPGFVHIFDSTFHFVRKIQSSVSVFGNPIQFDAGHLLIPGLMRTADRIGKPLHVLGLSGVLGPSFGDDDTKFDSRMCAACISRHLSSPSRSGHVWVARHRSYVIEQYSPSGQRTRWIAALGSRWFPETIGQGLEAGELIANQSIPVLRALWTDSTGLLYVLGGATASGRVRAERAGRRQGVTKQLSKTPSVRRMDVIDVIDPVRSSLLVSKRFTDVPPFRESMGGGYLFNLQEDSEGHVRIAISKISLQR